MTEAGRMEHMEQMEVTETERKIILSYRKNTRLQPAVRKLLDIIDTKSQPSILNLRKRIPEADGRGCN